MSFIRDWVSGMLQQLDDFAEQKIAKLETCPECHHGSEPTWQERADAAEGCPCTDDRCACYVESERYPE